MHLGAAFLAQAGDPQRSGRNAVGEFHLVYFSVAPDGQAQPARQRVDDRYAHTVQATGSLVRVGTKLAPGMKLGHDDLCRRALEFVVLHAASRNSAAIVQHGH
jgi:hypothetical protein